jgi:hypothetical protein
MEVSIVFGSHWAGSTQFIWIHLPVPETFQDIGYPSRSLENLFESFDTETGLMMVPRSGLKTIVN